MANLSDAEWEHQFTEAVSVIHGDCTYQESAEMLRTLVKTGLLRFKDLIERPERFFKAHRLLLAPRRIAEGSGFGVRFTVQFNLFAGSILGMGSPEQIAKLDEYQRDGVLGCFCLTEVFAGVNSGMIVDTTATWDADLQQFVINSPERGAKNWISQGLTATHTVVIADLIVKGKSYGPHGFVLRMRDLTNTLLPGITVEDMGRKTVSNDLDNGLVRFNNVCADKSTLLSRFAEIRNDAYFQTTDEKMRIEVLGQRLLTGRLAIAQASVIYAQKLFELTEKYADEKLCWTPKGLPAMRLSDIPHIAAILEEGKTQLSVLKKYNAVVETNLNKVLLDGSIPSAVLVEQIAVSKIKSVQTAITLTDKLAREVGSRALMYESGFSSLAFLKMCQFAEGDSRILMQKLARDSMKAFKNSSWTDAGKEIVFGNTGEQQEMKLRFQLSHALAPATSAAEGMRLWNDNWQLVYELAEAVCSKYVSNFVDEEAREQLFVSKL